MNFTSGMFSSKTLVYIINGINIAWPDKSRAKEIEGKKEKKNIKYMYAKRVKYKRNEKSACLYYPFFNKETRLR